MKDKKAFALKNDAVKTACINTIQRLEADADNPFQVVITSGTDLRSIFQNRLYYKHIGEIYLETGEAREDAHKRLKRRFLHPIYMAGETKNNLLYQMNYNDLVTVKNAGVEINFKALFNKLLTTTDASVKQFSEYIDAYWPYCNEQGIYLTDPNSFFEDQ